MKDLLSELNLRHRIEETELSQFTFEPDFNTLESLISGYQNYLQKRENLKTSISILEDLRPIIIDKIAEFEKAEAERQAAIKREQDAVKAKNLVKEISKSEPGTKQSIKLAELTKLIGGIKND